MDEEAVLQLVGRLLDVAQDAGAHVGPSANMNMYYYRYGMQPTIRAWCGSCSKTSKRFRNRPTSRRSPTPGRGPSGWPG